MRSPRVLVLVALLVSVVMLTTGDSTRRVHATPSFTSTIAVGQNHTCAVILGGAMCWGYNSWGQIGLGAVTTAHAEPMDVFGLGSGVEAIGAGSEFTCALTTAGGVKCWGHHGLLGNGTNTPSYAPVDVTGLTSGVSALAVGYDHSCALMDTGGVKCWGANTNGALGDGTTTASNVPVDVVGLPSDVVALATSFRTSCALTSGGGVKCWGWDAFGQVGAGQSCGSDTCLAPVDVTGLTSGVAAISAHGIHACALTTTGGMKCWGMNNTAQLGDGTYTTRYTPVDVSGLTGGVVALGAGVASSCAVVSGGGLKCWGLNNNGQLGDGTTTTRTTPIDVAGLGSGVIAVATSGDFITNYSPHTCALTVEGAMKCWGSTYAGQLGDIFTCAHPCLAPADVFVDFDGDRCRDGAEQQTAQGSELSGGIRDPKNPHDYFNPTGDRENRVDDVLMVVNAYYDDDTDATPGMPPYSPGYNPRTDRSNLAASPNPWNTGAPDGLQRVQDILHSVNSYFHDCS